MGILADAIEHEAEYIRELPSNHEWILEELDRLESLRRAALRLTRAIEAVFEDINGVSRSLSNGD